MSDSAGLLAGTDLGAYRIVRCVATGGMGAVYEAEHRALRKRVAIKTPLAEAGTSPEGRARFVQEGKTASKLRHPHVVDITDVGEADDVAYLVMEYLDGESLSSRIAREGPLPPDVIADTLIPVAAALHEAHAMGIIHRDLKPENIFLTQSVQGHIHPKILDFGISKVLGDESPRLTHTSNGMLGTPNYLSPEQLYCPHSVTPKSDQYALGVVIYEAATGDNPFDGRGSLMSILRAIDKGDYARPRDVYGQIDERLEQVALRAMSVSPDARYASMAALAAELLPLASPATRNAWAGYFASEVVRGAASARPNAARSLPRRLGERRFWLLAAASLVALAVGSFTFVANTPGELTVEAASMAPREAAALLWNRQPSPVTDPASPEPAPGRVEPAPRASISRARSSTVRHGRPPARPPRAVRAQSEPEAAARDRSGSGSAAELERSRPEPPPRARAVASRSRRDEPLTTDNVDPWNTTRQAP